MTSPANIYSNRLIAGLFLSEYYRANLRLCRCLGGVGFCGDHLQENGFRLFKIQVQLGRIKPPRHPVIFC